MLAQGHDVLVESEALSVELKDQGVSTQETLGLSGELGEHEGLAWNGLGTRVKRVSGEGEDEESSTWLRNAGRFADALPELGPGRREIPYSVRDHDVERSIGCGKAVHCRLSQSEPTSCLPPRSIASPVKHGHGEVDAEHLEAKIRERAGVTSGSAADVENTFRSAPCPLRFGESDQCGVLRRS